MTVDMAAQTRYPVHGVCAAPVQHRLNCSRPHQPSTPIVEVFHASPSPRVFAFASFHAYLVLSCCTNTPNQVQGADKSYNYWYQSAHAHLLLEVMPRLTDSLVDWWPVYFLWGASAVHRQSAFSERVYLYREGTFGTGYIVVSLNNLYTIALKKLTARYPGFDTGIASRFLSRLGGESESRRPLDEDNMAVIALDSIIDAQVIKTDNDLNTVAVRTANETVQVFAHFTGAHDEIVTAIRMAKSGKLATLMGRGKQPAAEASRPQATSENALDQLQQLKQMLDLRLITEKEYETKKAEILTRM